MKKIISLFQRNHDGDRLVRNEIVPGAEWVVSGDGIATVKHDGTCCMIRRGKLYRRYDSKKGQTSTPDGWEPAQDPDPETGHWPGWVPVGDGPQDRWHREALGPDAQTPVSELADGTYELCGPKVQGNPEGYSIHMLVPHGYGIAFAFPRAFDEIKAVFSGDEWRHEGIVWHHDDGRMVKIKAKDFGIQRRKRA